MKQIKFKRLEIKNFKATASRIVEIPNDGLVITAKNGAGKSTILEAINFALGSSVEAQKVINSTSKAPAFVSLTVEHPGGVDVLTRTLTPTLDAAHKVTASTSSYTINGQPKKQTEFNAYVADLFGTKEWQYLLNPYLCQTYRDARNVLLQVSGAPSEADFLKQHNPQLAETIGNTAFSDFESREKRIIQDLGKKIEAIPARIEENAAMLQPVPEAVDEAPIHARLAEIREVLKGVDQANAERADIYNKALNEAREMQFQAAKIRATASEKVAEANKIANTARNEALLALQKYEHETAQHNAKIAQIKMSIDRARVESQRLAEQYKSADIQVSARYAEYQAKAAEIVTSDGLCSATGVVCPALRERGLQAAESAKTQALEAIKERGKAAMTNRNSIKAMYEEKEAMILSLITECQELESKDLGQAPTVPEEKVYLSTPDSLSLIQQAEKMEADAAEIIKSNRLEVAQRPTELVEEMVKLNDILTQNKGVATTQAQNDKINARIEELRQEESALLTTQLKHKQHLAQLADFYRSYAIEVTGMVNQLFTGTPYSIKLFDTNMSNEKGTPVMQPMINDSNNLSTAENLIFWIKFVERVLSVKHDIRAPWLVDNAECVSNETQFGSKHQIFVAAVDKCELTIWPLDIPKPTNAK